MKHLQSQRKNQTFAKSLLAASIASSFYAGVAIAADDNAAAEASIEVISVTGMRSSIQESTRLKRDAEGVVDAISSEDMGKFPDTNLAESLQRITGVSISRVNGEGSEVTVRGFAGDNNMVTLNGRMMPAATTYGAGSGADGTTRGGGTRAFDFANLASESVKSVEVYKTGKANIATGGIGATININTARPLDTVGFKANVGVKAVADTTNRTGSDITPELSGLISYSDDDSIYGVSLSVSHQERDSGYTGATVNNWNIGYWNDLNNPGGLYNNTGDIYQNEPEDGQLYARPNDIRYAFSNTQRVRDNAQLTLQFRPTDRITGTLDYTFAENQLTEHRGEITNWMQNGDNVQQVIFDDSAVATPIYAKEAYSGGSDEGYEQQLRENLNTLTSLGVNFEFEVNDSLILRLDAHQSNMHSRGVGPRNSGELAVGLGAPIKTQTEWFWGADLPTFSNVYDDSIRGANNNGMVDAGDVGSSIARIRNASQETDISQVKFDGTYEFDDGRFDFGVEVSEMDSLSMQTAGNNIALGNWGVANPGEFGDILQPFDLAGEFNDYPTSSTPGYGFIGSPSAIYDAALNLYPGIPTESEASLSASNRVIESTTAAYMQIAVGGELNGMPFHVLTGLRFEKTEVESSSLVGTIFFSWEDNDDVVPYVDSNIPAAPFSATNSYDNLLPTFDFDIDITDDLKGRFSFSKTIARAGLGSLGVSASNFGGGGGSTLLGAKPTASASNPGLLPLESSNVDLSLEWYFDEASYISTGFFQKNVAKFIGSKQVDSGHFGILDVTGGARAKAAAQAVIDGGWALDDSSLYNMMVLLEHPEVFPNGAADYDGSDAQAAQLAETPGWDLTAVAGDPEMIFRTNTPDNNKEAKIYGAEFAVQHFFGDTGFGVQANYTLVRGDIKFDNEADPDVSQFALIGLSDTANVVAMYEKDGWQARIAYNWRDEYLAEVNKGSSNNPRYVEAYSQIDLNVSYEVNDDLTVFFEGINLTEENSRSHARNKTQLWYLTELGARYQVGARYSF